MKNLLKYGLAILAITLLVIPSAALGGLTLGAMFTFSGVDFNKQQVETIGSVIIDEAFSQKPLNAFHTIVDGIITDKQIVYAGLLDKITKANAGCGTGATSKAVAFRQKFWTPAKVKVYLELCADEVEQSLMIFSKNRGINVDDITNTDIATFLVERAKIAMESDLFRIAWFNDKSHTTVGSSTGSAEIKTGVSLTDYNIINGFWKQLFAIAAADATRKVSIAANSQASFSAQDSVLEAAPTVASDTFKLLLTKADARLQGAQSKTILCTMSLFNKYAEELESKNVDASYVKIEGGFSTLQRRGVTVIGWDFWDRTIRADFSNGTKYFAPHRAVLTTKENLMIGIDDSGAVADTKIWYENKDEKNYFQTKYKVDAKVAVDFMVQVAY